MTYSLSHPDMDVDFGTYSLLTVIYTVQFTMKFVVPLPQGKHFKLVFSSDVLNHTKINQLQDLGRCCLVYKCACCVDSDCNRLLTDYPIETKLSKSGDNTAGLHTKVFSLLIQCTLKIVNGD